MSPDVRVTRFFSLTLLMAATASASPSLPKEAPLVRGPGLNQLEFEAFAEGLRRPTLAEALDLQRPGKVAEEKLRHLLEQAQAAWLEHSLDTARSGFTELTALADEADWRDSQREAIFYAFMRMAQLAGTSTSRANEASEWMEKAARFFPDLSPRPDLFPPPFIKSFSETHSRTLASAQTIDLKARFPEFRFVLVNGKKHEVGRKAKLQLPQGRHRITALSDQHAPFTEKLSANQLEIFRLNPLSIAQGSCEAPSGVGNLLGHDSLTVVYADGCLRTRKQAGWLHRNGDLAELETRPLDPGVASGMNASLFQDHEFERPGMKKKHWLWIGAGAFLTGAYLVHREVNRDPPPARVEPSHHLGF
jgi:hypothetical protein